MTPPNRPHIISVIVPTIGRPESLVALLASLAVQTRLPDEIIVADGSSTNQIQSLLDEPRWRESGLTVHTVRISPPNAVSQRQAAIAMAQGSLLLLLDDDVVLEPACIAEMLAAIVSNKDVVGIVADFNNQQWPRPTLLWKAYLILVHGFSEVKVQGRVIGPLLRFGYFITPQTPAPMEWIGTCNSLILKDAYDRCGGFSDFFLHRCTMNEDVDLGLKLARTGNLLFCPSARMAHHHAPGGRVSVAVAAEDDLYNRFLVIHRTQGRSKLSAFSLIFVYFTIETVSNLAGCLRRLKGNGLTARITGRTRALWRILSHPFALPSLQND